MSKFYLTTPIYYVNSDLHLGHAYTTVLADVFTRYHRLMGDDCFMMTGVDEHGQKVLEAANKLGTDPQAHCDEMAARFKDLWVKLNIRYEHFMRTTDADHVRNVKHALTLLHDAGDLYSNEYEGLYCTPCERYFTEKDLVDGKCPLCDREVEVLKERNWFFRMSKYQDWLIQYIEEHPDFIQPAFRRNEVLGFLQQPLRDLCISRLKERMSWGIELPFDKDYVCYVWVDALLNYVTGVGWADDPQKFQQWWPASKHLLAKDILTTHCVYWTTLLKALGLPLPESFLIHGYWLIGDRKMSKSFGNVIRPLEMIDLAGVDAFRFFLIRDMMPWHDASFTPDAFVRRVNMDLANDLGNMVSRVTTLGVKNFAGKLPLASGTHGRLRELSEALLGEWQELVRANNLHGLLEQTFGLLRECNQLMEQIAPWKLVRSDRDAAGAFLADVAETLRLVACLLEPVMPERCAEILRRLGVSQQVGLASLKWQPEAVGTLVHGDPVFPRIEEPKALEEAALKAAPLAPAKKEKNIDVPEAGLITFDEFGKVKLIAACVTAAERVEGADRLLRLQVDDGAGGRQIVAGVAQHYSPEEIIGKRICLVSNLAPAKIRGVESNGMLLAAKAGKALSLVDPGEVPPGSSIG